MTQQAPPAIPNIRSNPAAGNAGVKQETRGKKPGIPAKERPEIPADEFKVFELTGKEKADTRRKREERTPQQKQVDQIVYDLYMQNVSAGMENGNIGNWADLAVYNWPVSEEHAETALNYIQKACNLYGRRRILGEMTKFVKNGKPWLNIPFTVVKRQPRERGDDE